jgi:hypothetical protein
VTGVDLTLGLVVLAVLLLAGTAFVLVRRSPAGRKA